MKSKVSVSRIEYKGENRLMLKFAYNVSAGNAINKLAISVWSETLKSWLLPFNKDSVKALREIFSEIEFDDESSSILTLCEENNAKDEVLIWGDSDYLYVKINMINCEGQGFSVGNRIKSELSIQWILENKKLPIIQIIDKDAFWQSIKTMAIIDGGDKVL